MSVGELKVVPIRDTPSLADIPGRLSNLAKVVTGRDDLMTCLVLIARDDGTLESYCFGENPSRAEVVGLFNMAALQAASGNFNE